VQYLKYVQCCAYTVLRTKCKNTTTNVSKICSLHLRTARLSVNGFTQYLNYVYGVNILSGRICEVCCKKTILTSSIRVAADRNTKNKILFHIFGNDVAGIINSYLDPCINKKHIIDKITYKKQIKLSKLNLIKTDGLPKYCTPDVYSLLHKSIAAYFNNISKPSLPAPIEKTI
jgi:hypothetical protein